MVFGAAMDSQRTLRVVDDNRVATKKTRNARLFMSDEPKQVKEKNSEIAVGNSSAGFRNSMLIVVIVSLLSGVVGGLLGVVLIGGAHDDMRKDRRSDRGSWRDGGYSGGAGPMGGRGMGMGQRGFGHGGPMGQMMGERGEERMEMLDEALEAEGTSREDIAKAMEKEVDKKVKSGDITKEQGERIKQRIDRHQKMMEYMSDAGDK